MSASCKNSQAFKDLGKYNEQQNQEAETNLKIHWDLSFPSVRRHYTDFPFFPSGCMCILITIVLRTQNTWVFLTLFKFSAVTEYEQSKLGPLWGREKEKALARCCLNVAHSIAPTLLSFSTSKLGKCCFFPAVKLPPLQGQS